MSAEIVSVDESRCVVALGKFRLSLQQNGELMQQIGAAQLLSVRRTFRDEGSPAHSWAPLAPSTIRRNPKKYGAGHKLLVDRGNLLNSINFRSEPGMVIVGTNLKYAAVHQFGSLDRGSVAVGPRTRAMQDATVNVRTHGYFRLSNELGKIGARRVKGPRNRALVIVEKHGRHQNIPARPYLVFRPEDPQRIRGLVTGYINRAKAAAGLGGAQ